MRRLNLLAALAAAAVVAVVPAQKPRGSNYAFLVACQDYDIKQLRKLNCPRADMRDLKAALIDHAG